jgi:hypothetical protein
MVPSGAGSSVSSLVINQEGVETKMKRFKRWAGTPWLAFGLVVGLLLAPAAAYAAVNLVGIVGSNGKRAQVTGANQLQTAEATPAQFKAINFFGPGACTVVFTVPNTKAFVLKQVLFDVYADPTPGGSNYISISAEPTCNNPFALVNPGSVGGYPIPLEPGFALKAGAKLYGATAGNVAGDLYMLGYFVPKSAVGSTTSVSRPIHARVARAGGS